VDDPIGGLVLWVLVDGKIGRSLGGKAGRKDGSAMRVGKEEPALRAASGGEGIPPVGSFRPPGDPTGRSELNRADEARQGT
jgi:hypothetical protein